MCFTFTLIHVPHCNVICRVSSNAVFLFDRSEQLDLSLDIPSVI